MAIFVEHREDLYHIIRGLKSQGKQVVFTNGVFDLLHVGHIRSLIDARSRGDFLIVALNSDKSAKGLKGPGHPVQPLKERVEILSALACVDYVTVLQEYSADSLLDYLRPNIHAKGRDYTKETVPERDTVLGYGGTIAIVGDPKDHSTTSLFDRIAQVPGKKRAARTKATAAKREVIKAAKKRVTKEGAKKKAVTAKKSKTTKQTKTTRETKATKKTKAAKKTSGAKKAKKTRATKKTKAVKKTSKAKKSGAAKKSGSGKAAKKAKASKKVKHPAKASAKKTGKRMGLKATAAKKKAPSAKGAGKAARSSGKAMGAY